MIACHVISTKDVSHCIVKHFARVSYPFDNLCTVGLNSKNKNKNSNNSIELLTLKAYWFDISWNIVGSRSWTLLACVRFLAVRQQCIQALGTLKRNPLRLECSKMHTLVFLSSLCLVLIRALLWLMQPQRNVYSCLT